MPRFLFSFVPDMVLFLAAAFFVLCPSDVSAQFSRPEMSVETYGVVSSSGTTPFWLQSNRHGIFSSEGSQLLTRIQAHGIERFGGSDDDRFTLRYGADFIARPGDQATASFNQGYLRLDAWGVFLQAGRFHNTSPTHDEELGMGSLGVSGNAVPIPQIRAGLADWTSLPFTSDFIQIKGHLAHGWLGSKRFTDNVLYHEKVGHARFGGDLPFNLYGGLAHYALWGGTNHPLFGELPDSFSDYRKVFFVQGGDPETAPEIDALYMLGDHLGAWDFGFYLDLERLNIKAYRQFPLETKDNLKLSSPQDALTGISIRFAETGGASSFMLNGLVYEYLYTKWQDGPRVENVVGGVPCSELPPGTCRDPGKGNENYYNHSLYKTGWAYNGRTIGNPLFQVRDDRLGFDNSRIVAHHLGLDASLFENFRSRLLLTYSRNYGTRGRPFPSALHQWSAELHVTHPVALNSFPIDLIYGFAYDHGELIGSQTGVLLGVKVHL